MPSPLEFDDSDHPIEDHEYPDESDWSDDDYSETASCPNCGSEIYIDSEWCSVCGEYISMKNRPTKHPAWVVAVIIVLILALATTLILW